MDAAKWPQNFPEVGLVKQPMEEVVSSNTSNNRSMLERKARPPQQEQLNCPRCNSTNTKFCYYNNYSLTQPRYFCKTCRRYWTEGGSLRNVPVGGGSRKNKRSVSSSSSSSSSAAASSSIINKLPDLNPPRLSHVSYYSHHQNPNNRIHKSQDLNLAFQFMMHNETNDDDMSQYVVEAVSKAETNDTNNNMNNMSHISALDLLRTGISSRGLDSFIPTPMPPDSNTLFASGFIPLQDIKPATLSFSLDHGGGGSNNNNNNNNVHHHHGVQENNNVTGSGGRLFFPFGELKQLSSNNNPSEIDQNNKGQQGTSTGYWNGMLGGGSW